MAMRCAPSRARSAPGRALPDDARAQLGELVRRVAAGEQVEHVLELLARELAVGVGAPHERVQLVDLQLLDRGHRDDLLAQDVERDARHARVLDLALEHAAGDRRGLHELAAEARVDAAARGRADRVAGPSDALQAARDGAGRGDLDDEVDGAHVDAELERRGGDDARQRARLERLLDLAARLARERAVVRARDRLLAQLVEAQRQPLGHAPAVDEHDRRAVRAHELEQLGVERGPERVRAAVVARPATYATGGGLGLASDRPASRCAGRAPCACRRRRCASRGRRRRSARSPRAAAAWPTARRAADRARHSVGETLERERQVRAALGRGDRVHLVDDHRLDAGQDLPRARGEHQVEALGRRDQDVRRRAQHAPALLRRRVARAHRDARRRQLDARGRGARADARERCAQVALDVVVERLERRDVEHAQALARLRHEAVEEPQEGRQRLARARRRAHQHVLARRDRRPALRLRGRRRAERALEPAPCVRREAGERVNGGGGHRRRTIRPTAEPRQRSSRSNESRPLAVTTMAAASVMRARDDAVARLAAARARSAARRARCRPARRRRRSWRGPGRWPRPAAARRPRRRCTGRCGHAARGRRATSAASPPRASGPVPGRDTPNAPRQRASAIAMTSARRMARR